MERARPEDGQPGSRERQGLSLLAAALEKAGWSVRGQADRGPLQPDLVARRGRVAYAVELKVASEGRSDRLVPLLAQAVLEARRAAGRRAAPLAVVAAPRIPQRAAQQVLKFAQDFAADSAVGVIDFEGFRAFRGRHLEGLDAEAGAARQAVSKPVTGAGQLFSDLNQWMLKVLLAPELPERLLSAPRGSYRNASELARAANVSVMSAFRFVQHLQREGYLDESASHLSLVRREDLFARWQALSARSAKEAPIRFVLPGHAQAQLRRALSGGHACLALFAAADALQLGFVAGVPPYVYVDRLQPSKLAAWKSLRPCAPGESPDVIVRQAPAPQSVFRGAVNADGIAACDVLQVWVDVAAHPSRGREQADLIRKRVLRQIIEGER
jgi:hypothetical protein